jgi:regulator of sigma E protease
MSDVFTSIFAVTIVLGIMILVHEWGHFMAAKLFGVRVEIFSLGFGPRLWGRRRGPTDYRISALPLGGYVKMAGDNPTEERKGDPDEFLSKPRWQRAIIAVAGPTMNIVMAVVLFAGIFIFVGIPTPVYLNRPAEVAALPKNSPAAAAGIQPGDRVVEIDGLKNPTWEQAINQVRVARGPSLRLVVERSGNYFPITVPLPETRDVDGLLGYPAIPPVVDEVGLGMPAEKAGLRPGDELLALNDEPLRTWPEFVEGVRHSGGRPIRLLVRHNGREEQLQIQPIQGHTFRNEVVWQIGVTPRTEEDYKRLGVFPAFDQATVATLAMGRQILGVVGQLFTGKVSLRQMQGVIGIARESGRAAKRGTISLINLMAVISLNLAILNLLPIPILDGGHILLLAIEGGLRRDLSITVKERFVQVGLLFLLVIFFIVMYNDVSRLLPNR